MSGFCVSDLLRSTSLALVTFCLFSAFLPSLSSAQEMPVIDNAAQQGVVNTGEIVIENVSPEVVPDASDLKSPQDNVKDVPQADAKPVDAVVESVVTSPGNPSDPTPGALSGDGTASISAPTAYDNNRASIDGENEFFDAQNIVPQGEMSKKGPVKVNPRTQPASKMVTVTKDYKADTKTAKIVSAERAMSLGMYDSALVMFEDLYKDNPREPRVLMGKAVSLQKLGRFDEAMQTYEVLSTMDAKNINVKVNMLGLLSTRYPAVALRQLLDLMAENSDNIGLTAQVAVAYAQTGDYASSMKYFGVASSMEPQNAGHIYNMAIMADRAGDKSKAIQYYEQSLEIDAMYGSGKSVPRDVIYERLSGLR